MMETINTYVAAMDDMPGQEFETRSNKRDAAFKQSKDLIEILLKSGYVCKVKEEEYGIIVVEFDHQDENLSSNSLEWIPTELLEDFYYWKEHAMKGSSDDE